MIHPDSALVWIGATVGRGVRATRAIGAGTLVWARDRADAVYAPEALARLPEPARREAAVLGYRDHLGQTIVCADAGRFVNHSCRPAMRGVGPDAMIAVRDLGPGDELTCDYAECNLAEPLECACGEPGCRRRIDGADLGRFAAIWQAEVDRALAAAGSVAQPLLDVAIDRARLAAVIAGRAPCPPLVEVWLPAPSA